MTTKTTGTTEATELANLVSNLFDVRQRKAALEKVEKTLLNEIKPLVDPELDKMAEAGEQAAMSVGGFAFTV